MILDDIVAVKTAEISELRRRYAWSSFGEFRHYHDPPRGFSEALLRRAPGGTPAVIAEIKRASPSAGVLSADADAATLARDYETHGAAALSVLTDTKFFGGGRDDFLRARGAVGLPVLRKDFILDEFQLLEARAMGADAVLLIAAILDGPRLRDLHALSTELGMDVLVEVHDPAELGRIDLARTPLVGINNRNLATMVVDRGTTRAIGGVLPPGTRFVSESGIRCADDMREACSAGAVAVLMGEVFMKTPHPGLTLKEMLDEFRQD